MCGHGEQHCSWSWNASLCMVINTKLCMVMECNTVHGLGVQPCAWSSSTTLCMVMECNPVHGFGVRGHGEQHCS